MSPVFKIEADQEEASWTAWAGKLVRKRQSLTANLRHVTSQKSEDLICTAAEA